MESVKEFWSFWQDTPVKDLSNDEIMVLKHELLSCVCDLSNELSDREERVTV